MSVCVFATLCVCCERLIVIMCVFVGEIDNEPLRGNIRMCAFTDAHSCLRVRLSATLRLRTAALECGQGGGSSPE